MAVSAAAVIWRRRCPYFFVGWFWYLGMLTPVLGLVRISDHTMADRYMYLPGIGLYIALAWGATRLAARRPANALGAGGCAVLAIVRSRGSGHLADVVLAQRRDALATCLGDHSRQQQSRIWPGRRAGSPGPPRRGGCLLSPGGGTSTDAAPFNGLGVLLAREGNYEEAISQFRQAPEIEPDSFLTHVNLGMALSRQQQFDEAREQFQRTIEIHPRGTRVHRELAHLLFLDGKTEEARAELELAVEIDPRDLVARDEFRRGASSNWEKSTRRSRNSRRHWRSNLITSPPTSIWRTRSPARRNRQSHGSLPSSAGNRSQQPHGPRKP